jgi:pimeloyl-ACP methyl ester carboxylesterase
MEKPTYVLVHGAWGGAWCWRDLAKVFDARGVRFLTLDLPSSRGGASPTTDLSDDARSLALVANTGSPVTLVGHSYGGAVITEAAPHIEHLKGLIYIAALVPDAGESATDVSRLVRARTQLDSAIKLDGEILSLKSELVPSALYGQCSKEVKEWATSKLSTQTLASFRQARTAVSTPAPRRYIRCSDDHAVDPSLQALMAGRCDESIEIYSDHSPFLSHPEELADVLLD